jgi:hypothetical protein
VLIKDTGNIGRGDVAVPVAAGVDEGVAGVGVAADVAGAVDGDFVCQAASGDFGFKAFGQGRATFAAAGVAPAVNADEDVVVAF